MAEDAAALLLLSPGMRRPLDVVGGLVLPAVPPFVLTDRSFGRNGEPVAGGGET